MPSQTIQWFPGHMAKTRRKLRECLDLVDAVAEIVDSRIPASSRNPELAGIIAGKPLIIVLNKCDLGKVIELDGMEVSAKNGEGMDALVDTLVQFASADANESETVITNERHYECLLNCKQAVDRAIESAEFGMPVDMLTVDIQTAIENLGEITGQTVSQEIVDRVFHNFCLGK